MGSLSQRDANAVWHPYTQSGIFPHSIAITHGKGSLLFDDRGKSYIDAIGSWWVNLHGHAHPAIAEAIATQAFKLEQVIFAGFTHEPAVQLAEELLKLQPHFGKVFFSDNGSTAVEVALKAALQYWINIGEKRSTIVAMEHAYHGDTFGAMSVSERSLFTRPFWNHLFEVKRIPFPEKGAEEVTVNCLKELLDAGDVAAFIVEPCVLGSGGMFIYSSEVLQQLFSGCKNAGTLIIADEVMTGFGRTGSLFCTDKIDIKPDFMCLSKGLTGGFLPLGVTLCSDAVHRSFVSSDFHRMLFHGHSFTANPLACAAAIASLELLLSSDCEARIQHISKRQQEFVQSLAKYNCIQEPRNLGVIAAWDLRVEDAGYASAVRKEVFEFFFSRGILIRPMGNVMYILPPYCITDDELSKVHDAVHDFLSLRE